MLLNELRNYNASLLQTGLFKDAVRMACRWKVVEVRRIAE